MSTNDNRKNSHDVIDHIFHDLLPARGMTERPEQVSLCHLMLDAMLDGSIALCDAGTGIGKTYSYLAAGVRLPPYEMNICKSRFWRAKLVNPFLSQIRDRPMVYI